MPLVASATAAEARNTRRRGGWRQVARSALPSFAVLVASAAFAVERPPQISGQRPADQATSSVRQLLPVMPVPASVTTLFRAGDNTLGLFDPASALISYFAVDASGKIRPQGSVALEKRWHAPGGSVLPDRVIQTSEGKILLLSRELRDLSVFGSDGSLQRVITPGMDVPYWFSVGSDGDVVVFGFDLEARASGYEHYDSRSGQKRGVMTAGWIQPSSGGNGFTALMFERTGGIEVELAVHFPFLRISSPDLRNTIDLRTVCADLPVPLLRDIERFEKESGLPQPFGGGMKDDPRLLVAYLDATSDRERVWGLVNGRILVSVRTPSQVHCEELVSETAWRDAGLFQASAVGGWIFFLERKPVTAEQRIVSLEVGAAGAN